MEQFSRMSVDELVECFGKSFGWLVDARGRMGRLVDGKSPEVVVENERRTWDRMVERVKGVLSTGVVHLNGVGETQWAEILEEYGSIGGNV